MFNIHVPEAETFCNNYIVNDHSISESEDWLRRSSSRPRMSRVDFTSWSSASSCPLAPSSLCLVTVVGLSSFWAAALWVSTSSPSVSVGYDFFFFFFFFFLWCRQPATIALQPEKIAGCRLLTRTLHSLKLYHRVIIFMSPLPPPPPLYMRLILPAKPRSPIWVHMGRPYSHRL